MQWVPACCLAEVRRGCRLSVVVAKTLSAASRHDDVYSDSRIIQEPVELERSESVISINITTEASSIRWHSPFELISETQSKSGQQSYKYDPHTTNSQVQC